MGKKFEFAIRQLQEVADRADGLMRELKLLYGTKKAKGLTPYKDIEEKAKELREAIKILMEQ